MCSHVSSNAPMSGSALFKWYHKVWEAFYLEEAVTVKCRSMNSYDAEVPSVTHRKHMHSRASQVGFCPLGTSYLSALGKFRSAKSHPI